MAKYEFISYVKTPAEKYLGIVSVNLTEKRLVLRYKVVQNKDGHGFFLAPASYKIPDVAGGDQYIGAFMLDSNAENEEVINFCKAHVKQAMGREASVFSQAPIAAVQQANTALNTPSALQPKNPADPYGDGIPF